MKTKTSALALLVAAGALVTASGATAAPAEEPRAVAAEYCVVVGEVHYGPTVIWPGSEYCVPAP